MRSSATTAGADALASQYNDLRKDAAGAGNLLVHEQSSPGMTLYVEPGVCYVGATRVIYAGGNSPSITNPVTNPRIDLITIDSSGTIGVTAGTENASPSAPTYPSNKLVLAEVYLRTSGTTIRDTDQGSGHYIKTDARPFLGGAYIANDNQVDAAAAISFSKLNYGAIGIIMLPDTDNTRNFGSGSFRWKDLYAVTFHGDGSLLTGVATSQMTQSIVCGETIAADDAIAPALYQAGSAIAIDTAGTAASTSTSITIGSHSDRVLILAVQGAGSNGAATNPSISWAGAGQSIKYHGDFVGAGNNHYEISYAIVYAPAVGTNTFSVSSTWGTQRIYWWSLYNCAQSGSGNEIAFDGVQNGTSLSISGAATVDGALYLGIMGSFGTSAPSNTTGNVYAANTSTGTSTGYAKGDSGVSNLYASGTSMALSMSGSTSASYVAIIIEIVPLAAPVLACVKASSASANNRLNFMGFAQSGGAAGATITATIGGIHTFASFATIQSGYYLNDTQGAIGTSAGSQSKKIGMGLGTKKILIAPNW